MKTGTLIKNSTSKFFVLAVSKNKALLFRISDGEVVVADDFVRTGTGEDGFDIYEWGHGYYYGPYMNHMLKMFEGLRGSKSSSCYVKTSKERAAFLESFGDKAYEDGLEIIAENESVMRTNDFIDNNSISMNPAALSIVYENAKAGLNNFFHHGDTAFNYDAMDEIIEKEVCKIVNAMTFDTVLKAVDRALDKYSEDNVDVVRNEETNQLMVMYHSDNNSFPIETCAVSFDSVNIEKLEKALDERHVGHVW